MDINFQFYPRNTRIPDILNDIVLVFKNVNDRISSSNLVSLKSNEVLEECRQLLIDLGYEVEGKHNEGYHYLEVPVLFGRNNTLEKSFRADAYHKENRSVIEIEAGRGVMNNQFLKDLFQACMMQDVDYLTIAVKNEYKTKTKNNNKMKIHYDFEEVCKFFDALYSSDRLVLPLKGILIIGY